MTSVNVAAPELKRRSQVSLSTLLLATACFAIWWSYISNRTEIARLESRLTTMRPLVHELFLKDHDQIAVIRKDPTFYDQQVWHVYVPVDSLSLHLSTRDIPVAQGKPPKVIANPVASAPLTVGRHVIELNTFRENTQWITTVSIDHQIALTVREPESWNAGRGSSGGGNYSLQADFLPDQPVILFQRVFTVPVNARQAQLPTGSGNGILLWIE